MKHYEKIFFCKQFKELALIERLRAIEQLGACKRCLMCLRQSDECKGTYLCSNGECTKEGSSDHHFLLCMKGGSKGKGSREMGKLSATTAHWNKIEYCPR